MGGVELLTISEVAEEWRVSPRTIQRWIAAKSLPVIRHARTTRIRRVDATAFINNRWQPAKKEAK